MRPTRLELGLLADALVERGEGSSSSSRRGSRAGCVPAPRCCCRRSSCGRRRAKAHLHQLEHLVHRGPRSPRAPCAGAAGAGRRRRCPPPSWGKQRVRETSCWSGGGAPAPTGPRRRAGCARFSASQAGDHAQQGGLAAARAAEQREDLALADVERTSRTARRRQKRFPRRSMRRWTGAPAKNRMPLRHRSLIARPPRARRLQRAALKPVQRLGQLALRRLAQGGAQRALTASGVDHRVVAQRWRR